MHQHPAPHRPGPAGRGLVAWIPLLLIGGFFMMAMALAVGALAIHHLRARGADVAEDQPIAEPAAQQPAVEPEIAPMRRAVPAPARQVVPVRETLPSRGVPSMRASFHPHQIVDRQQGGLVVGTIAVPDGWNATSQVQWNYSDVSLPVRLALHMSAPDNSAWLDVFPTEVFYWLEPYDRAHAVGAHSLGMIHHPGINAQEALRRYLIGRYRGNVQGLQVLGVRPIGNLAQALGKPAMAGESLAARLRYTVNGRQVDEECFTLLSAGNRIPYTGPQGTTYEDHRVMTLAHCMGATDGKLDGLSPVLGFVVTSFRPDPVWERHCALMNQKIHAEFDRLIQAGYEQIAAAGRLSHAISANNDAMLQSMQAQRQASYQASAQRSDPNEGFSQYIRGVEKTEDPYWGTSEHSYTEKYHWTDGSGNYQHSNDATFNPNIGSNVNWQLMQPAK